MSRGCRIMIVHFHWPQHTSSSPSSVRPSRGGSIREFSQIRLLRTRYWSQWPVVAVMGRKSPPPESHVRKGKTQSGIKSYLPLRKSVRICFDSVAFLSEHKCHSTIQYSATKYSTVTTRCSGLSAHRRVPPADFPLSPTTIEHIRSSVFLGFG
jgi:hypothetical protein